MSEEAIQVELTNLDKHARLSRFIAWLFVFIMISVITILVVFFYSYSDFNFSEPYLEDANTYYNQYDLDASEDSEAVKKLKIEYEKLGLEKSSEIQLKKLQLLSSQYSNNQLITTLSISVVRVGSVVIVLYFIQIMLSLTRYHFRLADHLFISVRILKMHGINEISLDQLSKIVSSKHIDIGRPPVSLTDRIMNTTEKIAMRNK